MQTAGHRQGRFGVHVHFQAARKLPRQGFFGRVTHLLDLIHGGRKENRRLVTGEQLCRVEVKAGSMRIKRDDRFSLSEKPESRVMGEGRRGGGESPSEGGD
jgi:hypothetical protein